jgi:hypothetical protein
MEVGENVYYLRDDDSLQGDLLPLEPIYAQKPQKWGIKIWCMACSLTKYVWNFAVYCGKNEETEEVACARRGEARLAQKVVLDLVVDIQDKGHVISTDNFFTSVGLFRDLASIQIYATGTVRANRIGLPLTLKAQGLLGMQDREPWSGGCMNHGAWHLFYGRTRSPCYFFPLMPSPLAILACPYPQCLAGIEQSGRT